MKKRVIIKDEKNILYNGVINIESLSKDINQIMCNTFNEEFENSDNILAFYKTLYDMSVLEKYQYKYIEKIIISDEKDLNKHDIKLYKILLEYYIIFSKGSSIFYIIQSLVKSLLKHEINEYEFKISVDKSVKAIGRDCLIENIDSFKIMKDDEISNISMCELKRNIIDKNLPIGVFDYRVDRPKNDCIISFVNFKYSDFEYNKEDDVLSWYHKRFDPNPNFNELFYYKIKKIN